LNVPIPYPLRNRLTELRDALDDADLPGVPIREIVATILLYCEEDGAKLRELVEKYRNAPPDHAAIGGKQGRGKVVPFRQPQLGRPPRSN
jgi:hypothetical protein